MRINYHDQAHTVSVVVHDAKVGLEGIIQGIEDHLTNDLDFTREKIAASACALRYILALLGNASERVETSGERVETLGRQGV